MSLSRRFFDRLKSKQYRESYVAEHVRTGIAYQIRALRTQRGWAQKKLAQTIAKPQSVVSRLEDPDYGKLNVQTLLEVAAAFDVGLLIQYVSFPEFIRRTRDVSPEALWADSFNEKQLLPTESAVYPPTLGLSVQEMALAGRRTQSAALQGTSLTFFGLLGQAGMAINQVGTSATTTLGTPLMAPFVSKTEDESLPTAPANILYTTVAGHA